MYLYIQLKLDSPSGNHVVCPCNLSVTDLQEVFNKLFAPQRGILHIFSMHERIYRAYILILLRIFRLNLKKNWFR